jgi:hypothetical protein
VKAIAKGIHPFFRARALLVASRATERAIEAVLREGLLERVGLHDRRVLVTAVVERVDVLSEAIRVRVNDELESQLLGDSITVRDHLAELPRRVDVEKGERQGCGRERLLRQAQHDGAVFADRVHHHRVFELGDRLA